MGWPQSQDYNEAIQSPQSSFGDAEMRGGQAVTNALGMPMPRSGNFADVYEFIGASGQKWAVKCFTRHVPGLQERYGVISKHLLQAKLPFTVDFSYLAKGIRIGGEFYPILKMQWVEGFLLNEFVRDNLDKPALLDGLGQIWLRMGKRLAEADIAHADLQHGNVILVPGSKASSLAVKLIDYDGMWLPALAQKKSGEVGHPNYQHPERLRMGTYSAAVDRLPLLAIACALRCLAVGGKTLWDKYDNGDNLLFRETDLRDPRTSGLFKELWTIDDPASHDLTGYLAAALTRPLGESPLLPDLINGERPRPLTASDEQTVGGLLGPGARIKRSVAAGTITKPLSKVKVTPPPTTSGRATAAAPDWDFTDSEQAPPRVPRAAGSAISLKTWLAMAGAIGVCVIGALAFWVTRTGEPAKGVDVAMVDRDAKEAKQAAVKPKDTTVTTDPKQSELPPKNAEPPAENIVKEPQPPPNSDSPKPSVTPVPPPVIVIQPSKKEVTQPKRLAFGEMPVLPKTANGLMLPGLYDCAKQAYRFQVSNTFFIQNSWALTFDCLLAPTTDTDSHLLFFWGDERPGRDPIYVRQRGKAFDTAITDCNTNRTLALYNDLKQFALQDWVNFKFVYDVPTREVIVFVNDKLIQSVGTQLSPTVDRPMPVWIGGANSTDQRFNGKIKNIWLGNYPEDSAQPLPPENVAKKSTEPAIKTMRAAESTWNHLTKSPTGVKEMDGYLSIDPGSLIGTKKAYSGPIEITAVVRSFNQPVYLHAFDGKVVFNLPGDHLRLHRPGMSGTADKVFDAPGQRPLASNTWYKIRWRISEHNLVLSLDDRFVLSEGGSYELSHGAPILLHAINRIDVKEISVERLPPEKLAQTTKGADTKQETDSVPITITPALLKKKLHGKAKHDKNTGTLTLAYDFQSRPQLKDFDFGKDKSSLGSGGFLLLQPNTQAKHIVKFKDVTITATLFVKAMRGRLLSTTDGSKISFGGLYPDTIYMDSGRLGHREFVVPSNDRTGYIPMRFALVQPQVAFKYGRHSLELGAGSEPKAGFVEFYGGELGYSFGQLTLSGTLDDAWAQEFFGGASAPANSGKKAAAILPR